MKEICAKAQNIFNIGSYQININYFSRLFPNESDVDSLLWNTLSSIKH